MDRPNPSLYDQGHIVISAVRLFTYREGKMPSAEEIAGMTGMSVEITLLLCRRLIDIEALRAVEGAFRDRYCVRDHLRLEDLPREVDADEMDREIERFRAGKDDEQKRIDEMFRRGEFEEKRREEMKTLEEKFREHASEKPVDPFGPPDTGGGD